MYRAPHPEVDIPLHPSIQPFIHPVPSHSPDLVLVAACLAPPTASSWPLADCWNCICVMAAEAMLTVIDGSCERSSRSQMSMLPSALPMKMTAGREGDPWVTGAVVAADSVAAKSAAREAVVVADGVTAESVARTAARSPAADAIVRHTFTDFKRTHADMWDRQRELFEREQLDAFNDGI